MEKYIKFQKGFSLPEDLYLQSTVMFNGGRIPANTDKRNLAIDWFKSITPAESTLEIDDYIEYINFVGLVFRYNTNNKSDDNTLEGSVNNTVSVQYLQYVTGLLDIYSNSFIIKNAIVDFLLDCNLVELNKLYKSKFSDEFLIKKLMRDDLSPKNWTGS